jgi:hypothetical protein
MTSVLMSRGIVFREEGVSVYHDGPRATAHPRVRESVSTEDLTLANLNWSDTSSARHFHPGDSACDLGKHRSSDNNDQLQWVSDSGDSCSEANQKICC